MQEEKIRSLFDKYVTNRMSPEELEEFLNLIQTVGEDQFFAWVEEWLGGTDRKERSAFVNSEQVLSKIKNSIKTNNQSTNSFLNLRFNKHIKYAASLAALLAVVFALFYFNENKEGERKDALNSKNEIYLPDAALPIVKLQNGRQLEVAEREQAELHEVGIELSQNKEGELTYHIKNAAHSKRQYHTFVCPKGASLKLVLADGSIAYLNSGAELKYPSVFDDKKREIDIEGEIYLEVKHDRERPFYVNTKNTRIKVLGTKFNIDSKNSTKHTVTTLLEGAVEIEANNQKKLLSPGYKAVTNAIGGDVQLIKADLKEVMAWREGYFRFTDDGVETVLEKIKDWYAIENYSIRSSSQDTFTGMLRRTNKLSELLEQLELISNYKFKIEDGRVLVM